MEKEAVSKIYKKDTVFFPVLFTFQHIMSFEQEVTTILEGRVPKAGENGASTIALAKVEVSKLLEVSKTSLLVLCQNIEQASTRDALARAFRQLNSCTRILTSVDPLGAHDELVRGELIALQVSARLKTSLTTSVSVALT